MEIQECMKYKFFFFSVLAKSSKKVNNFRDSVAEAYLNYGCYKEFINISCYEDYTLVRQFAVTENYLD